MGGERVMGSGRARPRVVLGSLVLALLAVMVPWIADIDPAAAEDNEDIEIPRGFSPVPWTLDEDTGTTDTVLFPGADGEYTQHACWVILNAMIAEEDAEPPGSGTYWSAFIQPADLPTTTAGIKSVVVRPTSNSPVPATGSNSGSLLLNRWNFYNRSGTNPREATDYGDQVAYKFFAIFDYWRDYTNPRYQDDDDTCGDHPEQRTEALTTFRANARFARVTRSNDLDVSCKITSQLGPGGSEIGFEGTVNSASGSGYQQEWTFSDGTKSSANLVSKTATKPGEFTGTFRAWIPGTVDKSATCNADVDAPELGLSLSFPTRDVGSGIPDTTFEVGDVVPFELKVRATADGIGDLTAEFLDDPLSVIPAENVSAQSGPTPEIPDEIVLAPGETQTFAYELVVDEPGKATLLSTVQAHDAIGRLVGPIEGSRQLQGGTLQVEATITPDTVELEEDEDDPGSGPVPKPVAVSVEVTNPLDEDITSATLRVVAPQLVTQEAPPPGYEAFTYLVEDPDGGDPIHGVPEDIELGTIEKGKSKTIDLSGLALNAGSIDLAFIVEGLAGGVESTGTTTERLEIRAEVAFEFDAEVDDSSTGPGPGGEAGEWVTGGDEWSVKGSFENRTHDETLEVAIVPIVQRNASYGVPIPRDTERPDEECGIGMIRQLEPGDVVRFDAPVRTILDGSTRSVVRYVPKVFVVNDDGTRVALEPSRLLVTPGSDEHEVSVDTRTREPEPVSVGDLLWNYSDATIVAVGEMFSGIAQLAIAATDLGLRPWDWPEAYEAVGDKVSEYVLTIYENLSPADKAAWNASWISAIAQATGKTLTDAEALMNQAAFQSFSELANAWESGDSAAVARWWGTLTGNNIDTVLGGITKAYGVCKLISTKTPWAKAALAAKEAKIAKEVAELGVGATARSIPTGATISRAQRRAIWGIDDVMYRKVQDFVDEFGVSIGVRRRGPGSIAKIESGTHYPKAYWNKAKNISKTDVQWMGMVDDLDTAALIEPPKYADLVAKLDAAGASKDLRAQVLARHKTRMKEWYGKGVDVKTGLGGDFATSERYKWSKYVEEGFPVPKKGAPLDYSQNVAKGTSVPPDDVLTVRVKAEIRTVPGPDGRDTQVLFIDRGQGMKPMTGDMDPVVVTNADFSLLPEAKRLEFYERAHELGFEHVESASWNDPGRNEYLLEFSIHTPNSEALYTWVPNESPRATRFDPQKTWVDPLDAALEKGRVYLRGTKVVINSARPVVGREIDDEGYEHGITSPKTIFLIDSACPGPAGGDTPPAPFAPIRAAAETGQTCQVVFDRDPDAIILRQTPTGDIERWVAGTGWVPYTVPEDGPGFAPRAMVTDRTIEVLPQSVSTDDLAAGATEMQIASAADLDLEIGVDEWFAVGDRVVIDPGGPNEETATIASFGSLVFTAPLANAHPAGTLVSVVDPLGDPLDPKDPSGPYAQDPPPTTTTTTTTTTSTPNGTTSTVPDGSTTPTVTTAGPSSTNPGGVAPSDAATGQLPRTGGGADHVQLGLFLVVAGVALLMARRLARRGSPA